MIPTGASLTGNEFVDMEQPSKTYCFDFDNRRILGFSDELDAVKQAVYKILLTERFNHFIYSFDYGAELGSLAGSPTLMLKSEISRRIHEALTQDDRVTDVSDFQVAITGDSAAVQFTVVSKFGRFRKEVVRNV